MSDEETVTPAKQVDPGPDTDILLYDYSKFLLTTTLLAFGGVLTLSGSDKAEAIKPATLVVVLVSLAISGFSSISAIAEVITARRKETPLPRRAWWMHTLAVAGLGAGVGAFSFIWLGVLF